MAREWDPDVALASLAEERSIMEINVDSASDAQEAVRRIFRENAQAVALGVVHTSLHSSNERVRLDAQKYVIEQATKVGDGDGDPLAMLMGEIYGHLQEQTG